MVNGMADPENDMMISHNLPGFIVGNNANAFIENDCHRRKPAKVQYYHEVLAFSPFSREHLSKQTLETIARKYIEMRNPRALCFAVAHRSQAHIHLHFAFSGVEYRSHKTLRMDNKVFENLRFGMERYQQKEFPELHHSIVYLGKEKKRNKAKERDHNTRRERQYQMKKNYPKKQPEKERISALVCEVFNNATTVDGFIKALTKSGMKLYERGGKVAGVIGKRKYRFGTLGITKEMFRSLSRLQERYEHIRQLRDSGRDDDVRER